MATKRGKHLYELNRKRAVTVRTLKASEKSQTDGERLKREMQNRTSAAMWLAGMAKEKRP